MPAIAQDFAIDLAIRNRWMTSARKPGLSAGPRPHASLAVSACVVGLSELPYVEQQRILMLGAKKIAALNAVLPNREKVRLFRSDTVRPVGFSYA